MTYDQLFKSIKAGDIKPLYVFYGDEQYLVESAVRRIREALLPEGLETFNENVYDTEVSVPDLISVAGTLPLMADKRLVLVKRWNAFQKGFASEKDEALLCGFLDNPPDSCCLIFWEEAAPGQKKQGKSSDDIGGRRRVPKALVEVLEKKAEQVEFTYLEPDRLYKWCSNYLAQSECGIEQEALLHLADITSPALIAITRELDKLSSFVGKNGIIKKADVDAMVTPSAETTVFRMIDMLMQKRLGEAFTLLSSLLENGEKPIGIIALLTRQMRLLTHIMLMRQNGISLQDIAQRLNIKFAAASSIARGGARFKPDELEECYKLCIDTDYAIKSGKIREDIALNSLMLKLGGVRSEQSVN